MLYYPINKLKLPLPCAVKYSLCFYNLKFKVFDVNNSLSFKITNPGKKIT